MEYAKSSFQMFEKCLKILNLFSGFWRFTTLLTWPWPRTLKGKLKLAGKYELSRCTLVLNVSGLNSWLDLVCDVGSPPCGHIESCTLFLNVTFSLNPKTTMKRGVGLWTKTFFASLFKNIWHLLISTRETWPLTKWACKRTALVCQLMAAMHLDFNACFGQQIRNESLL